jgi:negative regulator of flagellin synthesis FlgM
MRVDPRVPSSSDVQTNRVNDAASAPAEKSKRSAPSRQDDNLHLSGSHETVSRLRVELKRVPEVRQERVQSLRDSIQDGRYQINDQQLADAILSDSLGRVTVR